jgi:hypothetical protein
MGDLVKLKDVRKRAERKLKQQRATNNRLLHGRSKAEQKLDSARMAKARRDLDQHRVETGDDR